MTSPAGARAAALTITVVIPAKDEEQRIGHALDRLVAASPGLGITEIIVVDDGSKDRTGAIVREAAQHPAPDVRLLRHEVNRGKSASLRTGMLAATGDLVALFDADLSVAPEHLSDALALIGAGADLVIGRRGEREGQSLVRRLGSRLFGVLQRSIVRLPFVDTQCPFKVVRREALGAVLPHLFVERWNFDVEFLVVAIRQGLDVRELPVEWKHVDGSTIRLTPGYFVEQPRALWQIRRAHGSGRPPKGRRADAR
ncbi:MAG: glycosyltransferase [Dehalococcoidia bacterium]|nr:glycosyltransferase [Dehalococcoidia bacterium]